MSYRVSYTNFDEEDLKNIYIYILYNSGVPQIAEGKSDRIINLIKKLDRMPLRYGLYPKEPWLTMGLRYACVESYLVLYTVDEIKRIVNIMRIMHKRQDVEGLLNKKG